MNRTDTIRIRLAQLELELAERALYGEDVFAEGDVITFSANFGNVDGIAYSYAAIKAGGSWHLTGKETRRLSWDEVVNFFQRGNVLACDIRVVTKTKRIHKV